MDSGKSVILGSVGSPMESRHSDRGKPGAVLHYGSRLSKRQQALLEMLPGFDSRAVVRRDRVSMIDLAALTAATGDEFAMFTRGPTRLVIRGDSTHVNITEAAAAELNAQGYRWSGHTHPGLYGGMELIASDGDVKILRQFCQEWSVIYNSKGQVSTFHKY